MALPWIGVALWIRFERDRSVDGARLRGSETDRHTVLPALLKSPWTFADGDVVTYCPHRYRPEQSSAYRPRGCGPQKRLRSLELFRVAPSK